MVASLGETRAMKIKILMGFLLFIPLLSCNVVTSPMPSSSIWPSGLSQTSLDLELMEPEYFDGSMPIVVSIRRSAPLPTYVAKFQNGDIAKGNVAFWQRSPLIAGDIGSIGMLFQFPPEWVAKLQAKNGAGAVGVIAIAHAGTNELGATTEFLVLPLACDELRADDFAVHPKAEGTHSALEPSRETCVLRSAALASDQAARVRFDDEKAFRYKILSK